MSTELQTLNSKTLERPSTILQPAEVAQEVADPRRWFALIVLLVAAFMDLLDASIVSIAIPSIQRDLSASYATIQWMIAGYGLAFALSLITGGRLGDIFGRKRIFMLGVTGFTLASLSCGMSGSPEFLLASRVLQGAFAAIMIPQVLSIIQVGFPRQERAKAFGMYGAIAGLATVAGPLLGGILIEANLFGLDWRPIFLINLPVGILALVASFLVVRESRSPNPLKLDIPGMLLITLGLLLLVYPLVQGRELDWPAWTFVSMFASVPVLIAFALYEQYKTRRDGSPLVELSLFRQRSFVAGLAAGLIFFAGISSFFLVFTLYLQIGLGWTALHAGLTGIACSLGAAVCSGVSIQLAPKIGRLVISFGALIMIAGIMLLIFTIQSAGTSIDSWQIVPSMLLFGLGMGLVIAPMVDIILAGVPGQDAGSASGVLNTTNQLGGAIGIAVVGMIFFGLLGTQSGAGADAVTSQIQSGLTSAGLPAEAQTQIIAAFKVCFHDRMVEKDPFVVPASCRQFEPDSNAQALPPQVAEQIGAVMEPAALEATKRTFSTSMQQTLWYEAGFFGLTFLLAFLLPRKARHYEAEEDAPFAI